MVQRLAPICHRFEPHLCLQFPTPLPYLYESEYTSAIIYLLFRSHCTQDPSDRRNCKSENTQIVRFCKYFKYLGKIQPSHIYLSGSTSSLQSRFSRKSEKYKSSDLFRVYYIFHLEIKFENFEVPSSMLWFPSLTKLSHISHLGGATGVATSVVQVHVYLYFCISISLTLYILYLYFDL